MKFCELKHCPLKDQYDREHCFYKYKEPQCWRGWIDAILHLVRLRFSP